MTYDEVKRVRLLSPGRWEGMTLSQVGRTRDGLRHLRLLVSLGPRMITDDLREAIRTYLEDEQTRKREDYFRSTPRFLPRYAR